MICGIYLNYDNFDKIDYFNPTTDVWCFYNNLDLKLTSKDNFVKSILNLTPNFDDKFKYFFILRSDVQCNYDILLNCYNNIFDKNDYDIISFSDDVFDCSIFKKDCFINMLNDLKNGKEINLENKSILNVKYLSI